MDIYLVSKPGAEDFSHSCDYDSVVVVAASEEDARTIHPDSSIYAKDGKWFMSFNTVEDRETSGYEWVEFSEVNKLDVKFLGKTDRLTRGVVLASFNDA